MISRLGVLVPGSRKSAGDWGVSKMDGVFILGIWAVTSFHFFFTLRQRSCFVRVFLSSVYSKSNNEDFMK